ncbi:hypothetical protein ScPMuIL_011502 [Solemya velum]
MDEDEAIAIVGLGCRYPGADNLQEFWKLLCNGEDHVNEIPKERWNNAAFFDEDPDARGKTYVTKCGFIEDINGFDNTLWGISNTEAQKMDPQQRLVLECTHMAFEDGGFTRKYLDGSKTGVYMGTMTDDYRNMYADAYEDMSVYSLTGMSGSIISNRVSYTYNLHGPSITLDTACSSGLVAIDVASLALRRGDINLAVCGGVNVLQLPYINMALCRARMLSRTGKCHTFSADADGYARGEGCGVVILKKLKQARCDNDKIWGTIATQCNQDGRMATPITAPSGEQQKQLLELIYPASNIDAALIQYIEAHGTGTPTGDPIEFNSLGSFFTDAKHSADFTGTIPIGSVKTNVGHGEAVAGMTGLIKVLLMMEHGEIVPSLHFSKENANPNLHMEAYCLEVVTERKIWPTHQDGSRIACVNSFGFGGTNAHAIVKQLRQKKQPASPTQEHEYVILAFSAKNIEILTRNLQHFSDNLELERQSLKSIAYTSTCKRDHLQKRLAVCASSKQGLVQDIKHAMNSNSTNDTSISKNGICFVLNGVGTTWKGMCRDFMNVSVFQKTIQQIDDLLQSRTGWSIADVFISSDPRVVEDPFAGHICIFACQVGLASVWKNFGINPTAIVGMSVGEVAAAHISGSLSLEAATKVIYERSRLAAEAVGGSMCVVGNRSKNDIQAACSQTGNRATMAVHLSPIACTLSGDTDAIEEVKQLLKDTSPTRFYDLDVKCAYHSHHMEQSSVKLVDSLDGLSGSKPKTNLYSTVTGVEAKDGDFTSAEYWKFNLREPVKFYQTLQTASRENRCNMFIEIGAKATLKAHIKDIFPDSHNEKTCLVSMKAGQGYKTLLDTACTVYEAGHDLVWENINPRTENLSQLPKHVFKRSNMLFLPGQIRTKLAGIASSNNSHMFVKQKEAENEMNAVISHETTNFVYDHFVDGQIVVPGAVYAEIGLALSHICFDNHRDDYDIFVEFKKPLLLNTRKEVDVVVGMHDKILNHSLVFDVKNKNETLAVGRIERTKRKGADFVKIHDFKNRMLSSYSKEEVYAKLQCLGFEYGPSMTQITVAYTFGPEAVSEITVEKSVLGELNKTHLHPAIIDAMIQTTAVILFESRIQHNGLDDFKVFPSSISRLVLKGTPRHKMMVATKLTRSTKETKHVDILLTDNGGRVIAEIEDFCYRIFSSSDDVIKRRPDYGKLPSTPVEISNSARHYVLIQIGKSETFTKVEQTIENEDSATHQVIQVERSNGASNPFENEKFRHPKETVVLYFPPVLVRDDDDGVEVFNCVKWSCVTFLHLLKHLVSLELDIPVLVVTTNTRKMWTTGESQIVEDSRNVADVLGSEIWGIAKCAIVEFYYKSIILIDVDNGDVSAIRDVLRMTFENVPVHMTELRIDNGTLYSMGTESILSSCSFRQGHYKHNDGTHVEMKSANCQNMEDCFLVLKDSNDPSPEPNLLEINVEMACLNDGKVLPFTTTAQMDEFHIWQRDIVHGHGILSYETVGTKLCRNVDLAIEESSKKDPTKKDQASSTRTPQKAGRLVGLYPVVVSNRVIIPESCACPVEDIPMYRPGMLIQYTLLWTAVSSVSGQSSVCIVYRDQYPHVLEKMLQSRELMKVESVSAQSDLTEGLKCDTMLLVTNVPNLWLEEILKSSSSIKMVISNRSFLCREQELFIHDNNPNIKTEVHEIHKIFSSANLKSLAPNLFDWLRTQVRFELSVNAKESDHNPVVVFTASSRFIENAVLATNTSIRIYESHLFRKNATYVVVGGLTGLGWEIVRLLAEHHAGFIVTFSRRTPSEDVLMKIEELQTSHGCSIMTQQCDITEMNSLEKAFRCISHITSVFPLKGVFHGAATVDDGIIPNQTEQMFDKVLRPKVLGTWNLHILTRHLDLDYFVMHSSIASVFGNPGQSNYAAANAFMDAFAYYRIDRGLVATTINWGALDVGIAVSSESIQRSLQSKGHRLLKIDEIRRYFMESLISPHPQTTYAALNWSRLPQNLAPLTVAKTRALFGDQLNNSPYQNQEMGERFDFQNLNSTERNKILFEIVASAIGETTTVDGQLLASKKLFDLAIDSFQAMAIINRIYDATDYKLPLFFFVGTEETIGMVVDSLIEHFDQVDNSKTGDAMQPGIAEGRTRDSPLLTVATAGGETNGFQKGTILRYIGNESNGDQERTAYSLLTPFPAPIPTKRKLQKNRPNLKESFLKMLPNGMLHTVSVILEGGNNKHAHRNMLRWFSRKFSWNKELPVRHIVDVNTVRQFGWFALIVTARQQQYVFYKRELHPVQKWAEAIQERLLEK